MFIAQSTLAGIPSEEKMRHAAVKDTKTCGRMLLTNTGDHNCVLSQD